LIDQIADEFDAFFGNWYNELYFTSHV
jgi:hypothetical protein